MKLKTRLLITLIIFSFLLSLFTIFPNQKAHALWTTCDKYEDWKDLPPIDFSVDKTGNDTFTASITSPKSVMDRWATRAPNKDFMILAFNGNVAYADKLILILVKQFSIIMQPIVIQRNLSL